MTDKLKSLNNRSHVRLGFYLFWWFVSLTNCNLTRDSQNRRTYDPTSFYQHCEEYGRSDQHAEFETLADGRCNYLGSKRLQILDFHECIDSWGEIGEPVGEQFICWKGYHQQLQDTDKGLPLVENTKEKDQGFASLLGVEKSKLKQMEEKTLLKNNRVVFSLYAENHVAELIQSQLNKTLTYDFPPPDGKAIVLEKTYTLPFKFIGKVKKDFKNLKKIAEDEYQDSRKSLSKLVKLSETKKVLKNTIRKARRKVAVAKRKIIRWQRCGGGNPGLYCFEKKTVQHKCEYTFRFSITGHIKAPLPFQQGGLSSKLLPGNRIVIQSPHYPDFYSYSEAYLNVNETMLDVKGPKICLQTKKERYPSFKVFLKIKGVKKDAGIDLQIAKVKDKPQVDVVKVHAVDIHFEDYNADIRFFGKSSKFLNFLTDKFYYKQINLQWVFRNIDLKKEFESLLKKRIETQVKQSNALISESLQSMLKQVSLDAIHSHLDLEGVGLQTKWEDLKISRNNQESSGYLQTGINAEMSSYTEPAECAKTVVAREHLQFAAVSQATQNPLELAVPLQAISDYIFIKAKHGEFCLGQEDDEVYAHPIDRFAKPEEGIDAKGIGVTYRDLADGRKLTVEIPYFGRFKEVTEFFDVVVRAKFLVKIDLEFKNSCERGLDLRLFNPRVVMGKPEFIIKDKQNQQRYEVPLLQIMSFIDGMRLKDQEKMLNIDLVDLNLDAIVGQFNSFIQELFPEVTFNLISRKSQKSPMGIYYEQDQIEFDQSALYFGFKASNQDVCSIDK